MTRAFVFPGQGSQAVGMGRELAEAMVPARYVFEEVDEALKQNLSRLMFEGPEEDLTLTENAQPALMAVSLAIIRTLEAEGGTTLAKLVSHVAGHSLGEYSALAAARALTVADTARLLRRRGQAMQRAVPVGAGAMAALLGLDIAQASEVAEESAQGQVCSVANDNANGQVVVSGTREAVGRAMEIAKGKGAKRAVLLPVSAPFHCALMAPAANEMEEILNTVPMVPPVVPLVANVTANSVSDPDTIRKLLVEQITGVVRWRESVLCMKTQGVGTQIEAGAGKVLSGLVRRIDRDITAVSLQTPQDIEDFLKTV